MSKQWKVVIIGAALAFSGTPKATAQQPEDLQQQLQQLKRQYEETTQQARIAALDGRSKPRKPW